MCIYIHMYIYIYIHVYIYIYIHIHCLIAAKGMVGLDLVMQLASDLLDILVRVQDLGGWVGVFGALRLKPKL